MGPIDVLEETRRFLVANQFFDMSKNLLFVKEWNF